MTEWESQLRRGVVELAVLASIGQDESYGYRIVSDLPAARWPAAHGEHGLSRAGTAGAGRDAGDPDGGLAVGPKPALLPVDDGWPAAPPSDGGILEDGF